MTSLTNVDARVGPIEAAAARRWPWSVGLTVASAGLGSLELGEKGLWLDEIASLNFALGGPEVWFADHNMGLYYMLLAWVVRLFGMGESAVRALSVLLFVGSALVVRALGAQLFNERVARKASALYVVNATVVHFAQEARGYMLAVLLVSLSSLLLVRVFERRSVASALGYGVVTGLSLYAHLFAVWVALAHGLLALYRVARGAAPLRALLLAFTLVGAFAAPLGLAALQRGAGQISWIYPPTPARIWAGFVLLVGGSTPLALIEGALFGWFVLRAWRTSEAPPRALAQQLLLAWCVVPVAVSYGFSWLVSPIVHPKYLLVVVPALLLCVAAALDSLPRRAVRGALLSLLLLLSVGRLYFWYTQYQKERWRELVALLATRGRTDDALVLDVMLAEPLDYYVARTGVAARMPRLLRPARAWGLPPPAERALPPQALRSALAAAPRVWLVQNRSAAFDAQAWLGSTHRPTESLRFEPRDEDDRALFADSEGRVITLRLFTRTEPRTGADP